MSGHAPAVQQSSHQVPLLRKSLVLLGSVALVHSCIIPCIPYSPTRRYLPLIGPRPRISDLDHNRRESSPASAHHCIPLLAACCRYLTVLGPRPRISDLDHNRWESYIKTMHHIQYQYVYRHAGCRYLTLIGPRPRISDLEHNRWESYLRGSLPLPPCSEPAATEQQQGGAAEGEGGSSQGGQQPQE